MHVEERTTTSQPAQPTPAPVAQPALTPRERQIASYIADGRSNRDIAVQLGISEQTVKNHLTNIFEKVGVDNRLQLALAMLKRGAA